MNDLFEKFQHYLIAEKYVSENTVVAYTKDIQQFLDFINSKTRFRSFKKVTSDHVKDFLKFLKKDIEIGAKSASRKLSALKSFANYLEDYHDIPSFTQGVAFPKIPKQLPRHLSEEQINQILLTASNDHTISGQRNKVIICLLYTCGIRVSELVSLKTYNINYDEQCLHVLGKGGKERIVPLPVEMTEILKNYMKYIHPALIESVKDETEYLFPVVYRKKIEPITRQALWNIVKKTAQKAGMVHTISPHVLRHSLATHLLKKGANLRILQILLGHEKLNTVQVYTHLDMTHLKELYLKFHPRAKR